MSGNILLVGSNDRQLEAALQACGMSAAPLAGTELAALAQTTAKQPDVLVVDLRDQSHVPSALPILKRHHPSTGVIIVASRMDPAMLLEAMRAGVNEVLTDPISVSDLEAAMLRLAALRQGVASKGQVFAFLGAKGGVGTTTVAVNVATALAAIEPHRTLFIDLHISNGDAGVFLGADSRFSIADALENTHRLDEAFFRGLLVGTKSKVQLLASSDRVVLGSLDVRRVRAVVDFATLHFKYVVLDVPRSDPAFLDALEGASRIVVVANQELATVRSASRLATALHQRYGKERVSVVVSRTDQQADIGHEDVERAIGFKVKHSFPSDYRRALAALNKGRPLTLENHNELSGSLVKFAHSLAGVEKPKASKTQKNAGLFGLFGSKKPPQESK